MAKNDSISENFLLQKTMISEKSLDKVRIVLVNTSDPGNIGAAARAMKTMGLNHLYLVQPTSFPHIKASTRSGNALDVLGATVVVATLDDAIADCNIVFGTSTRTRELPWINWDIREGAKKILTYAQTQRIAILFGNERTGLINDELKKCHFQLHIPTSAAYTSLNLAAAIQVVGYEIFIAAQRNIERSAPIEENLATVENLENFYAHLNNFLYEIEFLKPHRRNQIIERLRRLLSRALPQAAELALIRGILTQIQKKISL